MRLRFRYVSVRYGGKPAHGEALQRTGWSLFHPMPSSEEVWRPPTDVYETETHVIVMMELAGVNEDDIEVTIFDDVIVVSGARADTARPKEKVKYHEVGINFGRFRSEVFLPIQVNPDCVEARYENGFLYIWLAKVCQ